MCYIVPHPTVTIVPLHLRSLPWYTNLYSKIYHTTTFHSLTVHLTVHLFAQLFPQISSTVLPEIAPVVKEYCRERGLPYNEKPSPFHLFREHAAFLRGPRPQAGPGIGDGGNVAVK